MSHYSTPTALTYAVLDVMKLLVGRLNKPKRKRHGHTTQTSIYALQAFDIGRRLLQDDEVQKT